MTKSKAIIATVALALAGVLGLGYVGASVWRNSWNPTEWVKPKTEIVKPDDEESKSWGKAINTATGEVLDEAETYAMPTSVMFMSERSESEIATAEYTAPTVTFTAAVSNEYLNIPLTLPESTEFLEVTPVNETTFTVKCLKPFSEKQKLTVTSTVDPTVKIESNVDYLKTVNIGEAGLTTCAFGESVGAYVQVDYLNTGTIEADGYELYGFTRIDPSCEEEFSDLLKFDIEFLLYEHTWESSQVTYVKSQSGRQGEGQLKAESEEILGYADLIKNWDSYNEQQQNAIKYVWYILNEKYSTALVKNDVYVSYEINGNLVKDGGHTANVQDGYETNLDCPEGEALAPIVTLTPDKYPVF